MDESSTTAMHQTTSYGPPTTSDEVSRIRDIIFGANMRDYERRFAELEQRLLQELSSLRSEMMSRFEQTSAATAAEFVRLTDRSAADVRQLHSDLQEERDSRAGSVQDLHDALQRARDDADTRAAELQALLEHRSRELRDDKTDRHMLGDLLRKLGESLQAPAADLHG
jgi:DNA anti-recombination protein RmuC